MAIAGNTYTITLKRTHLEWGTHRYTGSRDFIYGEGYIPIPAYVARNFDLFNDNNARTGLGYNIFNCTSTDGFFNGQVKTSGCSQAGDVHAKNMHGYGDLQALGAWYAHVGAQVGGHVEVTWVSSTDIEIHYY
ncbi:hypothetical protein [Anaerosporobacter sp.]|uniref:hypothetical protein n=1 Tax=Anaerosporobacter sp. TaxID=1872529 RepID=UPI00286ED0E9|nr:hypothetical protein [Anaerosporobacter sp.]